jgi:hypothetical protein
MILRSLPTLCRAATAGAFAMALASCSSTNPPGPGGHIVKVKYYRLDASKPPIGGLDASVTFEHNYHLHGAVSNSERSARDGHYYAVMWKVTDRAQPVQVRLEYRQENTGTKVHALEHEATKIKRSNVTHFEVSGEQFASGGAVTSWRITLVRGKQVLAEAKSYLWD